RGRATRSRSPTTTTSRSCSWGPPIIRCVTLEAWRRGPQGHGLGDILACCSRNLYLQSRDRSASRCVALNWRTDSLPCRLAAQKRRAACSDALATRRHDLAWLGGRVLHEARVSGVFCPLGSRRRGL